MSRIITKKEYYNRRVRFQVAAGFFDFLVTLGCFAVALLCLYLLMEMYLWIKGDVPVVFSDFIEIAEKALHVNR